MSQSLVPPQVVPAVRAPANNKKVSRMGNRGTYINRSGRTRGAPVTDSEYCLSGWDYERRLRAASALRLRLTLGFS